MARFSVDDRVALARDGDMRVFTVVGVSARRGAPSTVGVFFRCRDADGREVVFPSSIVVSERAKSARLVGAK
jgi:hypothetical protein